MIESRPIGAVAQCRDPVLSIVTTKSGGSSGGSPALHARHGIPAPPQSHASSRLLNISNGRSRRHTAAGANYYAVE